jgi:hypothetical protein
MSAEALGSLRIEDRTGAASTNVAQGLKHVLNDVRINA